MIKKRIANKSDKTKKIIYDLDSDIRRLFNFSKIIIVHNLNKSSSIQDILEALESSITSINKGLEKSKEQLSLSDEELKEFIIHDAYKTEDLD